MSDRDVSDGVWLSHRRDCDRGGARGKTSICIPCDGMIVGR